MKNNNLTLLDAHQIQQIQHDNQLDAQRVVIVGGDISESIKESFKELKFPETKAIEVPTIIRETVIKEIEKPIIVTEYKTIEIEKQIIVPEYRVFEVEKVVAIPKIEYVQVDKPIIVPEYRTIEVPVRIKEVQVERIEVPVIVKQNEPISLFIKSILIIQTLGVLARVFFEIIKH